MLGRLKEGDELRFARVTDTESTRIRGIVSDRAGNYLRVSVLAPTDHPNVTLETGTDCGPGITVCRDYSMEVIGHVPYVTVAASDYQTVIHAK